MYPELNKKGILYHFIDYVNKVNEVAISGGKTENTGLNRELSTINFYNQILSEKGDTIKIDPTGINIYNIFGEKVNNINDVPGTPVALALVDNDLYSLSINQRTGNLDVYYSNSNIIEWVKMDVNGNDATILPGIGVTSIYQVNLYESFYYSDLLFIIKDNKICWSQDKVDFLDLELPFNSSEEVILGISILPDGNMYILTDQYLYMIERFDINSTSFNPVILSTNNEKFNLIKGVVGTVINAVSIPLDTIDDFDINDKKIVNRLVKYYSSNRFMYYWYSTESDISIELFNENISRLQAKLGSTADPLRKKQIQRCIERQEYFKSKIA
jgi:hypothetical protein